MPDYRLENLGPRTLEQMIQSLAGELGALRSGAAPFD